MNLNVPGSVDPEAHFIAPNINDGNLDIVPDHDGLIALSGKN